MKAISILQPWAGAFFLPANPKDVENRVWRYPVKYRGPILIHTGLGTSEIVSMREYMSEDPHSELTRLLRPLAPFNVLPRGVILGQAELVDCLPMEDFERRYGPSPWACGPMCLVIRNARKLAQPIQFKGALGLFDVPDTLVEHGMEDDWRQTKIMGRWPGAPIIRRSRGI